MTESLGIIVIFSPVIFVIGTIIALLVGVLLPEKYYIVQNELGEFRARHGNLVFNHGVGAWRRLKEQAVDDIRQDQETIRAKHFERELTRKRRNYRRVK